MTDKGSSFFRPGTVFLFILIGLLGFGMYSWATTNLAKTGESSLEDQNDAIVCSSLEVADKGIQISQDQVTLFFEVNKDLERIYLNFKGEKNVTKVVRRVDRGRIQSATANVTEFSSVSLEAPGCGRVFRFE